MFALFVLVRYKNLLLYLYRGGPGLLCPDTPGQPRARRSLVGPLSEVRSRGNTLYARTSEGHDHPTSPTSTIVRRYAYTRDVPPPSRHLTTATPPIAPHPPAILQPGAASGYKLTPAGVTTSNLEPRTGLCGALERVRTSQRSYGFYRKRRPGIAARTRAGNALGVGAAPKTPYCTTCTSVRLFVKSQQ